MAKKTKHKGGGRWIQELRTDDIVEEEEGTFSEDNSAEEIALELKRKAPDFQAAMGKITLYLNRAGKRLSESRKKELNRVKSLLREMYQRPDRAKATKKKASLSGIGSSSRARSSKKSSSIREAANYVFWTEKDKEHHKGDQYLELLSQDEEEIKKRYLGKAPALLKYKKWLFDLFRSQVPYPDPKNEEQENEDFEAIKKEVIKRDKAKKDIPVFDVAEESPTLVPKPDEVVMMFGSDLEALQYLSDLTKERIVVANKKTFKCPECDSKVLEQTGYCVKCKKKVKKASEELVFASEDEAIQYLANITGKKVQVAE